MTERVNKLYKPADLSDAIDAVQKAAGTRCTWREAADIVKVLHADGWKVVRTERANK